MPPVARKIKHLNDYSYPQAYSYMDLPKRQNLKVLPKKTVTPAVKPRKKQNIIPKLISLSILFSIAYFILPVTFHDICLPIFTGKQNNADIKADYYNILYPTKNYLSNAMFNNRRLLASANVKKPLMSSLYKTEELRSLTLSLQELMKKYPTIHPSITVWDFVTGKYVDINGEEIMPAASIIKIPVLIDLFKSIESNALSIYDDMILTDYYKASGSGNLQYHQSGQNLTIDQLARTMIVDSDNSATNMLISKLGSMTDVNSAIRKWGIKHTYIQTWLPDLKGTNYTTSNDIATMLFNLDNPSFLSINSREYIIDYMSHVKNDRLIPQGLGKDASFIHKTGDIGTMLGDAGIVYLPNGKKYIIAILAKRPYNSPAGKEFIQQASKIIYNFMKNV